MKKILILALVALAALTGGVPAGAAVTVGGGRADGYAAPTPPGTTQPQAGEVALGSFVAPARMAASRHGAATGLKGNPTCAVQCITGGVAYGRGPDARLVVTTDTAATIRIVVSGPAGYTRQIISGAGVTSFSADFDDLEADTHYDAVAIAADANGDTALREGSFRTLKRNARLLFNEAAIGDAPFGDDPFTAQVWFEGDGVMAFDAGDADGGTLHLGAQLHDATDTDRFLWAGLELTQSDLDVDLCEATEDPEEPEYGAQECGYANTAWLADGQLDLDARPGGAPVNDYFIAGTMVHPNVEDAALPGGYGNPLSFSVQVAVHVTFTP